MGYEIFESWTDEEIREYQKDSVRGFHVLYAFKGLPSSNPAERAKFLSEEVLEGLTMTDHDVLMRIGKTKGRPEALKSLEWMAHSYLADKFESMETEKDSQPR